MWNLIMACGQAGCYSSGIELLESWYLSLGCVIECFGVGARLIFGACVIIYIEGR